MVMMMMMTTTAVGNDDNGRSFLDEELARYITAM
jgi:hypothetical protein